MKILVTGAYGQLGNELKDLSVSFPKFDFMFTDIDTLDITNQTEVNTYFEKNIPDFVLNCAAYTAVDKAETEIENAKLVNAIAPGILAKACKNFNAKLIHISTDYVFDGKHYRPYTETDSVNPLGAYGLTKLEGEQNCLIQNPKIVIIRTSWLYSSYGNNFVKTMLRFGKERDELKVVADQVGSPTYARDLAIAVMDIINQTNQSIINFVPGIYHYANEGVCSWFDFAKTIHELSNIKCNILPVSTEEYPTSAKRPCYSVFNKAKIKSTYSIEIPYWKDSLKECIEKINS